MAFLNDIKIMLIKGDKGDKGDGSYDDTEVKQMIADEALAREQEIAELETNFLNYMYPVGSIYLSVNSTSPATLFGGTWEKIEDKFLLCSGNTYASGSTGGVASNPYTPSGTVGNHTLTINEIPSHTHGVPTYGFNKATGSESGAGITDNPSLIQSYVDPKSVGGGQPHNHGFSGTATTFNNMPPYLTVNVWKRTA